MRAVVNRSYGPPEVLELAEIELGQVGAHEVLVEVQAAALNPLDWHFCTGTPYVLRLFEGFRRPKVEVRGRDMAGVIAEVGSGVTDFGVGDRVVGCVLGAFAEHVVTEAANLAVMPAEMSFADAAAMPIAAITALQGLRDHGEVKPGQAVLINGAAGGVGTYAVQIAKSMGAEVTAVCSGRNVEMVRSLGADRVVDYEIEDFAHGDPQFDVMFDNVGNRSLADCKRVLAPSGVYVMVSGPKTSKLLGPIARMVAAMFSFIGSGRRLASFTAGESAAEVRNLIELVEKGELRSVIDRHYPLPDTAEGLTYLATGHARAKVIIDVA